MRATVDIAKATLAASVDGLSGALAKARDKREPLDLDLPERRIEIGGDGKVTSIAYRERLESMRLIEEFMIQANVAAAETLEKARQPLIYRIHEQPSPGEAVRLLRLSAHHRHQSSPRVR